MSDDIDVDAMMATLSEMLPSTADNILLDAILTTGSVESAYDWILEQERQFAIEENLDQSVLQEIILLFPFVSKATLTEIVSAFPEMKVEELIDTVIVQLMRKRKPKFVRVTERQQIAESETISDAPLNINSFKEALESTVVLPKLQAESGNIVNLSNGFGKSFEYDFGLKDTSKVVETSEYYREIAQELIAKRADIYAKAAESFQRGGLTGKGYSSFLSEEGNAFTSSIEEMNAMAAFAALKKFNPKLSNSRILDLHGLTVREAEPLVHSFLRHHLVENDTLSVQIVTGHGRGSSQVLDSISHLTTLQYLRYSVIDYPGIMIDLSKSSLSQLSRIRSLLHERISRNEELDEVKTADLPYITVDLFMARKLLETNSDDRLVTLQKAKRYYELFYDWLERFELGSIPQEPKDALLKRQLKIQRITSIRELESKLCNVPGAEDEEVLRAYWLAWINHKYLQSIDEYHLLLSEIELITQRGDIKLRPNGKSNTSFKVSSPFILTREAVKDQVFRPAHTLPTMTIDQFLELELQRGNIIHGTGESEKKEPETDKEFDAETKKLRERDERWDWITKGSGNTYNRA